MTQHTPDGPVMSKRELEELYRETFTELQRIKREGVVTENVTTLFDELEDIALKSIGYYRVGYSQRSETFWARWKWTHGPYDGHYVFTTANSMQEALWTLSEAVRGVEDGKRKAHKDKPYKE